LRHEDLRRAHLPLLHAMAQAAVHLISGTLVPALKLVQNPNYGVAGEETVPMSSLPFFVGFHAGLSFSDFYVSTCIRWFYCNFIFILLSFYR
jgi:hypothetical protein